MATRKQRKTKSSAGKKSAAKTAIKQKRATVALPVAKARRAESKKKRKSVGTTESVEFSATDSTAFGGGALKVRVAGPQIGAQSAAPPPDYKDRTAKVIRRWSTPLGKDAPIFTDATPLKNLNPDLSALRHDLAAELDKVPGFKPNVFFAEWDKKPPKTVGDVYELVAKSFE